MQATCIQTRFQPMAPSRFQGAQQRTAGTLRNFARLEVSRAHPTSAIEVVSWAQQQFLQEIAKTDDCIGLAKTCLVLALEEEAVAQLEKVGGSARTAATASTWSLSRLDLLAAEVIEQLQQQGLLSTVTNTTSSSSSAVPDATSAAAEAGEGSTTGSAAAAAAAAAVTVDEAGSISSSQRQAMKHLAHQYPMQVLMAVNSVLFGRHGYSACNRYGTASDSQLSAVMESGPGSVAALTVLYIEVCSRLGLNLGFKVVEDGRYCLVWPKQELQQQQQQEQEQPLLAAGGEACVLDVYGKGALLTVKEATELFGTTRSDLFAGSSRRELLAALLAEQQHAHWCSAVGCSPQPAFMTPLNAATAVKQVVRQLNGMSIERATAAAEKRVALLPGDMKVQLDLALLCYFSGRYADAWLELGSYIEHMQAAKNTDSQGGGSSAGAAAGGSLGAATAAAAGEEHPDPIAAADAAAASTRSEPEVQLQQVAAAAAAAASPSSVVATATAGTDDDEAEGGAGVKQESDGELDYALLLFEKLQLELMMASPV